MTVRLSAGFVLIVYVKLLQKNKLAGTDIYTGAATKRDSFFNKNLTNTLKHKNNQTKTITRRTIKKTAYQQMRQTKEVFGKTDKRQGYHLILAFAEEEMDAETAFELVGKFVKEYLRNESL